MEYPAKITKIENQHKNKQRFSIFLNNEFAFGLNAAIVVQFGLKVGDALTKDQIKHVLIKEEKKRVKEKAFKYLSARAHSEKEIRIKLIKKGFEDHLVEEVITELKFDNLIDDTDFALSYANSRLINRPIGENLLRSELRYKGINDKIIEKTVHEAYTEKKQWDLARELANKKKLQYKDLEHWRKKIKMGNFLIRRGFDWELVKEIVEDLLDDDS